MVPTCLPPNQQMPNEASCESLPSQPLWHSSDGSYSQPPPPYSEETSAFVSEHQNAESYYRRQHSYPQNMGIPQRTTSAHSADAHPQGRPLSPRPRLRPDAPPLPPRPPRHTVPVLGLSDGPHSNVSFPPPPKRHNATPARYPLPLPPRPTTSSSSPFSSSKFMGGSSAMRWIEKTNQAIEDRLDAVLQGPAGHPSRPAYTSRPQHPGQHTPQSSTPRYNQTRLSSSEGRK